MHLLKGDAFQNMQLFLLPALVTLQFFFYFFSWASVLPFLSPLNSLTLPVNSAAPHITALRKMWMNRSYEWAQLHAVKTVQRLKRVQSFIAKCSFTPLLMASTLAICSLISSYLWGCGSYDSPRLVLTITEGVPRCDELLLGLCIIPIMP